MVIRKSLRSLIRTRSPTTESPVDVVVMRRMPLNGLGSDGKISLRNFAVCPVAGSEMVAGAMPPTGAPVRSVRSNVTLADAGDVLATAIPLSMYPCCPDTPDNST